MNNYKCHYKGPNGNINIIAIDRISTVKDGFWINSDYEFTVASDCKFWIPPSRIQYVEKIKLPV